MREPAPMRRVARGLPRTHLLLLFAALALGCIVPPKPVIRGNVVPGRPLEEYGSFYIPTHDDDRGIGKMLAEEITRYGGQVQLGESSAPPAGTDVLVLYEDKWFWDLGMYLLDLKVDFRDPETNVLIATATSNRPSAVRAKPDVMTREVVEVLYSPPSVAAGGE